MTKNYAYDDDDKDDDNDLAVVDLVVPGPDRLGGQVFGHVLCQVVVGGERLATDQTPVGHVRVGEGPFGHAVVPLDVGHGFGRASGILDGGGRVQRPGGHGQSRHFGHGVEQGRRRGGQGRGVGGECEEAGGHGGGGHHVGVGGGGGHGVH